MRIGMNKVVCVKAIKVKKVTASVILAVIFLALISSFFVKVYTPYINSICKSKANLIIQNTVNQTVLETLNAENIKSFTNIIKNADGKILGIETDTIILNRFKSKFLNNLTKKFSNIENERIKIPLFAFFNNPFVSEIGPNIFIKIKPLGIINTDLKSDFTAVGVNQSKHHIDLILKTKIIIVMPAMQNEQTVETIVPVAQTIILGEVPQSYTNVTAADGELNDTVLQLAEN